MVNHHSLKQHSLKQPSPLKVYQTCATSGSSPPFQGEGIREIREQIANTILRWYHGDKEDAFVVTGQILALKDDQGNKVLLVRADNQELPENPIGTRYTDPRYLDKIIHEIRKQAQSEMREAGFVKVVGGK